MLALYLPFNGVVNPISEGDSYLWPGVGDANGEFGRLPYGE